MLTLTARVPNPEGVWQGALQTQPSRIMYFLDKGKARRSRNHKGATSTGVASDTSKHTLQPALMGFWKERMQSVLPDGSALRGTKPVRIRRLFALKVTKLFPMFVIPNVETGHRECKKLANSENVDSVQKMSELYKRGEV